MGKMGKILLGNQAFLTALRDAGVSNQQIAALADQDFFRLPETVEQEVKFMDIGPDSERFLELLLTVAKHRTEFGSSIIDRVTVEQLHHPDVRRLVFKTMRTMWQGQKNPAGREKIEYEYWLDGISKAELARRHGLSTSTITMQVRYCLGWNSAVYRALDEVFRQTNEPEDDIEELEIDGLTDGQRTMLFNALRRSKISTIDELCTRTADDLLNITNFGRGLLGATERALKKQGRALVMQNM